MRTLHNVYDGYVDFAKFAKENGDTVGRKLIVPTTETNSDADFHRLMYTSSISEMGVNADVYWENFADRQETKDLQASFSCNNARTYTGLVMRAPE